jgi:hypothetical protein
MTAIDTPGWIVLARDAINVEIAGHHGTDYVSPPQSRDAALALVALLVGPTPADAERNRWTVAIAGGRRTVALEPAD